MASNYHIELNPSDVGIYDYVVVQEIIKEIAQYKQLDVNAKHPFKGTLASLLSRVVVVLDEVDNLSRNAQAGLRRTMEKYTGSCRLILCCENSGRIIAPIRSRCLCIRIGAPTPIEVLTLRTPHPQIMTILKNNCQREGFPIVAEQLQRIVFVGLWVSVECSHLTATCVAPSSIWRRAPCKRAEARRGTRWS